jgi:hypothetical protein
MRRCRLTQSRVDLVANAASHATRSPCCARVCSMSLKIGGISTTSLSFASASEQCGSIRCPPIALHGLAPLGGQPDIMARPARHGAALGQICRNGKGVQLTEHGRCHAAPECDDRDSHGDGLCKPVVPHGAAFATHSHQTSRPVAAHIVRSPQVTPLHGLAPLHVLADEGDQVTVSCRKRSTSRSARPRSSAVCAKAKLRPTEPR